MSTWPAASGVLVDNGIAYVAAGIANYDGTYVYALNAKTGKVKWQNNTSGHLVSEDLVSGVSVQGHLLLSDDRLYLAGGNIASEDVVALLGRMGIYTGLDPVLLAATGVWLARTLGHDEPPAMLGRVPEWPPS